MNATESEPEPTCAECGKPGAIYWDDGQDLCKACYEAKKKPPPGGKTKGEAKARRGASGDEADGLVPSVAVEDAEFAGTRPYVPSLTAEEESWVQTGADILADQAPVDWAVPGLVAYGALTNLIARPKAGKTQLVLGIAKAREDGIPFLGSPADYDAMVYLTEQGRKSLQDQLGRACLSEEALRSSRLLFIRLMDVRHLTWKQRLDFVEKVIKARFPGQRVLVVVDTFAKWASLKANEENDSGAMGLAMLPLQALAQQQGYAVLNLLHARKGLGRGLAKGEDGDAAPSEASRGSGAIGGDADINIVIQRPAHRPGAARRVREMACESRFGDTPERMAFEWMDDGSYVTLEGGEEYELVRIKGAILGVLAEHEERTEKELVADTGGTRPTVQRALGELTSISAMKVGRRGEAHTGYRYYLMDRLPKGPAVSEATEESGLPEGGVLKGLAPSHPQPLSTPSEAGLPSVTHAQEDLSSLETLFDPLGGSGPEVLKASGDEGSTSLRTASDAREQHVLDLDPEPSLDVVRPWV